MTTYKIVTNGKVFRVRYSPKNDGDGGYFLYDWTKVWWGIGSHRIREFNTKEDAALAIQDCLEKDKDATWEIVP